ncbi:hypothetical protein FDG95_gp190 [Pectobacterium phage vB_PcaM_CBB]|uniref:Uncharacterized protein n=1 Tax=Pectobacterium phage vB_PcaM_CBB TaxID=2772511 RepID=A0A1L2CUQ6_9CAUD|nr:hypothetical protein FDG95_gp190 [Pectobacterium phage vB_PcaM_CBB]AMM43755.1 hypothetical protein CBB_190 [Pectobacterium phage vB_PcaM_CBB]
MEFHELEDAIRWHINYITTVVKPDYVIKLNESFWGSLLVEDFIDANN